MAAPTVNTTPLVAGDARTRAVSWRWIISAREDLAWFFAPALLCYALFALYARASTAAPLLFAAVFVLLDTPHVLATYTRTYLDRDFRRSRRGLLLGALLLFLVGPAAVLAGQGERFFALAGVWAIYHQIRQHYGFAVIYKIKNGDLAPADNALDRLLFLFGFAYPLAVLLMRGTHLLTRLPSSLAALAPHVQTALLAAAVCVACAWLARQAWRAARGESVNAPKLLFFVAVLPLYWLVQLSPVSRQMGVAVLLLAPLHSLQYHRLVWFHNRKYADADGGGSERHGAAALVSRRLFAYAALLVALSVGYHLLRRWLFAAGGYERTLTQLLLAFILGHLLVHFYLDAKIWRVRRDPEVGESLRVR